MPEPITDDLIPEVRAALAKATPGPWRFGIGAPCHTGVWGTRPDANWNVCWTGDELTRYSSEDAHLIANAPAWLEALCDEVERLREAIAGSPDKAKRLTSLVRSATHLVQIERDDARARAEKAEAALERVRQLLAEHPGSAWDSGIKLQAALKAALDGE